MFVCYNHTLLLTVTKTLITLVKASQTKQIEGQNLTVLSILQQSGGPYIIHIIHLLLYRYSLYLATILLQRSWSSLEALHDIADAVRGLGADERYDKLDARIKALENQVAALAIALEEEMVKKGSEKESDDDGDEETEMDED